MALSVEEIRKAVDNQTGSRAKQLAMLHQNRLRFHTQTEASAPMVLAARKVGGRQPLALPSQGVWQAVDDFLAFVENLIPHDKFKIFQNLFRFPVATNDITAICYDKLSRIFEGRDPVYMYNFVNSEYSADWEEYRTNRLHEPTIWKTKGWEFFKTEINSVLVCDLPKMQEAGDPLPQPYFYWLPIRDVVAYSAEPNGQMRWIAFHQDGDELAVIDDDVLSSVRL